MQSPFSIRDLPLGLVVLLAAPSAVAREPTPTIESCATASETGQRAVAAHHFAEARRALLVCTHPACPAPIRRDCDALLSDVDADIPSIVLHLKDAGGHDVSSADVTVDGQSVPSALAGQAVPLDPGIHLLRAARGADAVGMSFVLHEGDKKRVVELSFAAPPVANGSSLSWIAFPLAGVGVASLAAFAGLAASGQSAYDACETQGCDSSRRSSLEVERAAAWITLCVGVASLTAATIVWVRSRSHEVSVEASTSASGARLFLQGKF
jgi:hypothetical protein